MQEREEKNMDLTNVIDEIEDIKRNLTMALRVLIDNDDNFFDLDGKMLVYYRNAAVNRHYIAKHFINESLTVLETMIEAYDNRAKESKNDAKDVQMP